MDMRGYGGRKGWRKLCNSNETSKKNSCVYGLEGTWDMSNLGNIGRIVSKVWWFECI